ncbi:MAG: hypothetical protein HUJ96_04005 [Marinilabiliaceae bacterium]|nr:hypothetical protein [Marinilabiliaceae bacterium]
MKKSLFFILTVISVFTMCRCTDDDDKVIFDGELYIDERLEDGCVISDSVVTIQCDYRGDVFGGSGDSRSLKYLIGTNPEDLTEYLATHQSVDAFDTLRLEPYRKYYWCVKFEANGGVMTSEMRTFYFVPPVVATTENGDGEWSTTLKWNELGNKMLPTTIKVTPNIEGYPFENNVEIQPGQNSYKFKLGDVNDPTNAAYTHWWDDANAIYYEPIIYTYEFTIGVKVDDRTFDFPQVVKDIIINKQDVVKDHEFNVYRLAKIGNKIWTIDDYRAKTYFSCRYGEYTITEAGMTVCEETGAVYYHVPEIFCFDYYGEYFDPESINPKYKNYSIPEGFHVSTEKDWLDLESFYGVNSDFFLGGKGDSHPIQGAFKGKISESEIFGRFYSEYYVGQEMFIKGKLSSPHGWETLARNDSVIQSVGVAVFNSKPTEIYYDVNPDGREYAYSFVGYFVPDGCDRFLSSESNGIARINSAYYRFLSIRLVKN